MKKLTINKIFLAILSCSAMVACNNGGATLQANQSGASGTNKAAALSTLVTGSGSTIIGKVVNLKPCIGNLAGGCGFDSGQGTLEDPYIGTPVKLYHVDVVYTNNSKELAVAVRTPAIPVLGNWSRTTWGCQAMSLLPGQSCTDTYSMIDNTPTDRDSLPLEQQKVTWVDEHNQSHADQVFESPLYVALKPESESSLTRRKIIFVTQRHYSTDLGGFVGADLKCNAEAVSLGEKSPHFKALLWGNIATSPGTEYYRKDRLTLIARATTTNLNDGKSLVNSIEDAADSRNKLDSVLLDSNGDQLSPIYTGAPKGSGPWLIADDKIRSIFDGNGCQGWTNNGNRNVEASSEDIGGIGLLPGTSTKILPKYTYGNAISTQDGWENQTYLINNYTQSGAQSQTKYWIQCTDDLDTPRSGRPFEPKIACVQQ